MYDFVSWFRVRGLLNQHWDCGGSGKLGHLRHFGDADVSLAAEGMAIHARTTGSGAVIEVDELQEIRIRCVGGAHIVSGIMSTGKYVACVHTDTKTWIRDALDKVQERSGLAEHLCTLTSRRLQ